MRVCKGTIVAIILVMASVGLAWADTWRGTAPFCDGECLRGEREIARSDWGDGGYCVTGSKALCTNSSRMCESTSTKAECYGVVMICENGSNDQLSGVWKACNSYACGVCLGVGEDFSIDILSTGAGTGSAGWAPVPCKSGFVWREAFSGDHVCVPPDTRQRAWDDNAQAAQRKQPGSDFCVSGYVWRETVPTDHVCVTPDIRSAAAEDNRLAAERMMAIGRVLNDTCKSGFVWREAVKDDHVCVTPDVRQQSWDDNDLHASRVEPGSDRCKSGFVWREVIPADHVCVPPETRAAAAADAAMAPQRVAGR